MPKTCAILWGVFTVIEEDGALIIFAPQRTKLSETHGGADQAIWLCPAGAGSGASIPISRIAAESLRRGSPRAHQFCGATLNSPPLT
jgi:hypothetical protein